MTDRDAGERLSPTTVDQLRDAVRWAVSEEAPMELVGAGTKRSLGRPIQTKMTLDTRQFSGISLYEPEELVMSARAATPLAEIEAALDAKGQELAFEPADYGPLYGGTPNAGTIGGVFAANLSGPRRMKIGAARDHLLGLHAVSGRGEVFKTGGRVVKNVTGYDLCKLLTGAFGTLGVLTDVTFKVLPRSEAVRTLSVSGLSAADAVAAMTVALRSAVEPTGAAFLPSALGPDSSEIGDTGRLLIRIEGFSASVDDRARTLTALLDKYGGVDSHDDAESRTLWRGIRDGAAFGSDTPLAQMALWRVSVPPVAAPAILDTIRAAIPDMRYLIDWGGGLLWIAAPEAADGGADAIRGAIAASGGHATLIRGSSQLRSAVPVFQPPAGPLLALSGRIKESFDPGRVLNPGRMYAGI
ncbi:glycolate oxidase subunit GlcE [Fodinicurvata sp. EGI_FJ10296]|uniref:glycolate oxidase subunit GlcE n=1 Tax=Fodinicurvata sp. EGI_FJ10296 TaxID=3231908 RepID=UPI003455063A